MITRHTIEIKCADDKLTWDGEGPGEEELIEDIVEHVQLGLRALAVSVNEKFPNMHLEVLVSGGS